VFVYDGAGMDFQLLQSCKQRSFFSRENINLANIITNLNEIPSLLLFDQKIDFVPPSTFVVEDGRRPSS